MFADSNNPHVQFGMRIWKESMYPKNAVPQGIMRHVLVSDIQPLRSFLPHNVLNSMGFSFDPLPPGPGFDDAYFRSMYEGGRKPESSRSNRGNQDTRQPGAAGDFIQRLMGYLQSNGEGQGLDPDTEAAIMAQLEQLNVNREGLVPGNFPGASDDDGEDEEGDVPRQNAGLVDFFRGLWQTNAQQPRPAGSTDEDAADAHYSADGGVDR